MAILGYDWQTLGIALLGGLIPALLWLWFWLKEDDVHPEPKMLLTIVFMLGMAAVVLVLPIQKFIDAQIASYSGKITLWALAEEVLKFLVVIAVIYGAHAANEPIDWPIYLITAAMGFAALENTLFLIKPLSVSGTTVGLLTGQLRFLGSTLLHAVASGTLGIAMGVSFFLDRAKRISYTSLGLFIAVALHGAFNFFIIRNNGSDFLKVFSFLWVVTIIVLLLFEKVRRMSK